MKELAHALAPDLFCDDPIKRHRTASPMNITHAQNEIVMKAERIVEALGRAGFVIVPKEPTPEMIEAALAATVGWLNIPGSALTVNREKMKLRWRAMIAAAPKSV